MSRESSMNYAKHQLDTCLNEFLEKFNNTHKQVTEIINSGLQPATKVSTLLVLLKNINNSLDVGVLVNLCASYKLPDELLNSIKIIFTENLPSDRIFNESGFALVDDFIWD